MQLSIVTTLYYSAPYVQEFYARATQAAQKLTSDYEIVFVNDGSPDDSLDRAVHIQTQDAHVRVVDLSRNFGHHRALMTGLAYAQGELIFLIDCDLEEDPGWLPEFHETYQREHCDVVYGVQKRRKGSLSERFWGAIFYRIFNFLSPVHLTPNTVTSRLMSRRYVAGLLQFRERTVFLAGLLALTGYRQIPVLVDKQSKPSSTYNPSRKLTMFVDAITSFSDRPLVYIFFIGAFISSAAAVYIIYLLERRIRFGISVAGWPSLIVSIWFLGGLTIFFIGVIGIYLSRIYIEVKERPYTIVRKVYGSNSTTDLNPRIP